jgi:hypothetical protein
MGHAGINVPKTFMNGHFRVPNVCPPGWTSLQAVQAGHGIDVL